MVNRTAHKTTGLLGRVTGAVLVAMTAASLASCGLTDELGGEPEDKNDLTVSNVNERAKAWWLALAEGDAEGAFNFLSQRCQDTRVNHTAEMTASYEQRIINSMASTGASSDEIVGSLETTIDSMDPQKRVSRVTLESSLQGLSMNGLRWVRTDTTGPDGQVNQWYLDNCKPPFQNQSEDERSYRVEMDRDAKAYREGMIEDNGNYNDGVAPGSEAGEGDDNDY